jgi:hypothetical protein
VSSAPTKKPNNKLNFYDNSVILMDGAIKIPDGEIIVGDCEDPNKTKPSI